MFNVELSVGDFDGYVVLALCGELDLFDASDVASPLIAAVAAYGPSIIVDLAGLTFIYVITAIAAASMATYWVMIYSVLPSIRLCEAAMVNLARWAGQRRGQPDRADAGKAAGKASRSNTGEAWPSTPGLLPAERTPRRDTGAAGAQTVGVSSSAPDRTR